MSDVVPVELLTAPTSGKARSGLFFRVGMSDEDFGNHGITHLIEHLAFQGRLDGSVHTNGLTTDLYSGFVAEGTPAEVADFLRRIVANLAELPLDRLEKEKAILKTEETRRGGPTGEARNVRHGVQDFGLPGVTEAGLDRLGAAEVTDWVGRYFTAGNAVAFVIGVPEEDWPDLKLPPGPPRPPRAPSLNPAVTPLPRFYPFRSNGVVVDAIVPRSAAVGVFAELAGTRFLHELRDVDAVSYSLGVSVEAVGAAVSRWTAVADTAPDNGPAVVGSLIDALTALGAGRFSPDEFAAARAAALADFDHDDAPARLIMTRVLDRLLGREAESLDAMRARYQAVTAEAVAACARQVWQQALWVAPVDSLAWAGLEPTNFFAEPVVGHEFAAIGFDDRIVVSDEGVTLAVPGGGSRTVRYASCAGVLAYPDGRRDLIALSGSQIVIEPTLFEGMTGALTAALIDAHVPAERLIPQPARRPSAIPSPPVPDAATATTGSPPVGEAGAVPPAVVAAAPSPPRSGRRTALTALFVLLAVLFGLVALVSGIMAIVSAFDSTLAGPSVLVTFIVVFLVTGVPAALFIRQARGLSRVR